MELEVAGATESLVTDPSNAAVVPQSLLVIRKLASCNTGARTKALREVTNWLPTQLEISDEEMKKLWKGLFYCIWHADKAPVQSNLINRLSSMLLTLDVPLSLHYLSVFLTTLRREWSGIDVLRLDKFYLLIRRFVNCSFQFLKKNSWDLELTLRVMTIYQEKSLLANEKKFLGNGVNYHIVSVFLDEIKGYLPLSIETYEILLKPLFNVMINSQDKVLLGKIRNTVFEPLLCMGKSLLEKMKNHETEIDTEVMNLGTIALKMGFSAKFYEFGSSSDCFQGNRKVLFGLQKEIEVNNQILNALFTLMCLYQHPHRLYHLILLSKWRPQDISKLRNLYSKNGTYKPNEWAHMMVVVFLLNLNCFAQYALCGLNVGYKRSERPAIGVALTVSIAISAPAIAGLYSVMSPLGKDSDTDTNSVSDEESQKGIESSEKIFLLSESNPKWSGGIFDFWEDISLAYLSLFCSFCVFGWNMERLGFGNMYVHMTTFLLFCLAPFWIFTLAAVNIENEIVREILGITGVFLCVFGLLYGGFWRIQMRKRFNLPSSDFCCGNPGVSDCVLWLCCCWCSLAQEVRTGNKYDVLDNKFYRKPEGEMSISPLPREEQLNYRSTPSPTTFLQEYKSSNIEEGSSSRGNDSTLEPPIPSFIHRDAT